MPGWPRLKILDASAAIALFAELDRPSLVDSLLKLGHALAIPGYVMDKELVSARVRKRAEELARQGKVTVLEDSTPEDLREFGVAIAGLGPGEFETIMACKRAQRQGKAYCILDDRPARRRAAIIGVPFTGVLGLLRMLKDRGIVEGGEIGEIVAELRRSGFRLPRNIDI